MTRNRGLENEMSREVGPAVKKTGYQRSFGSTGEECRSDGRARREAEEFNVDRAQVLGVLIGQDADGVALAQTPNHAER